VLIDVDHFKRFNDRYGHPAGDVVLRELAVAFSQQVRDIDLVTRYGGEEFAVVLPGTPIAGAVTAAERIRRTVEATTFPGLQRGLQVTISLGAAEFGGEMEAKVLIEQADTALYRSKDGGRNRSAWHDGREIHMVSLESAGPPAPQASPEPATNASGPTAGNDATPPAESRSEPPPDESMAIGDAWQFAGVPGRDSLLAALDAAILKWRCGGRSFVLLLVHVNDIPSQIASHGTKAVRLAIKRALRLTRASFGEIRPLGQLDDATAAVILSRIAMTQINQAADLFRQALLGTASTTLPSLTLSLSAAEVRWGDNASGLLDRAEESLEGAIRLGGNGLSLQTAASVLATELTSPSAGVASPSPRL
jgi:diguanylate cyclase (GGDEF)-like protein